MKYRVSKNRLEVSALRWWISSFFWYLVHVYRLQLQAARFRRVPIDCNVYEFYFQSKIAVGLWLIRIG